MKKIFFIPFFLLLFGCDYQGNYTFIVKNESSKTIEIKFRNDILYYSDSTQNKDTVILLTGEEKIVKIIGAPLNSPAHDCLHEHGMEYFIELVFDTYADGIKVEKQLWQPENWSYHEKSKWTAKYSMVITDDLIQ
jgi:hypothetical protein